MSSIPLNQDSAMKTSRLPVCSPPPELGVCERGWTGLQGRMAGGIMLCHNPRHMSNVHILAIRHYCDYINHSVQLDHCISLGVNTVHVVTTFP